MKSILERMASAARLCLPAVMLCALGGRTALAAPASAAPAPFDSDAAEWPETTSAPEEARIPDSMPEDIISTDAFRGSGRDAISRSMPREASLFETSAPRRRAPKGWKEDGQVAEAHASKIVPGPGDLAYGQMKKAAPVRVGDLLYVLRRDVPTEADADPDALYLERIGVVRVESVLPKGRVSLRVLKSATEVSPADLLSRTPL
ncbi:MAG: hypothetical protein NTY77_20460 [Elusimicrobia bacterium]|nr:hypothetical protein [Elusimicrobiota bacterium]